MVELHPRLLGQEVFAEEEAVERGGDEAKGGQNILYF